MPRDFKFNKTLSAISHSRGGLVAKYVAANTPQIPIDRSAFVACANGCGYFTAGWGIAKFLSIAKTVLRGTASPWLPFLTGLSQHSFEFFLNLPGCKAMTPGSDYLSSILKTKPLTPNAKFMPVIGDFDPSTIEGLFKRWGARGFDLFVKQFLGKDHDGVIGTKEQYIMPVATYPATYKKGEYKRHEVKSFHTSYFTKTDIKKKIDKFLVRYSIFNLY